MLTIGPENVIAMKPANITAITNFYASWSQANKSAVVQPAVAAVGTAPGETVNVTVAPEQVQPTVNTTDSVIHNGTVPGTITPAANAVSEVPVAVAPVVQAEPIITEAPQVMTDATAADLVVAPATPADMLAQEFAAPAEAVQPVVLNVAQTPAPAVLEVQPTVAPTIVEAAPQPINNFSKEEIITQINKIEEALASLKTIVNEKTISAVAAGLTPGGTANTIVENGPSNTTSTGTVAAPVQIEMAPTVNANVIATAEPIVESVSPVIETAPQQIVESTQLIPENEILPFAPPGVSGNIFDEQPAQQPISMVA